MFYLDLKKLLLTAFLCLPLSLFAKDDDFDKENLSKEELSNIIKKSTNLNKKQIAKIISIVTKKFGTDHESKLRIAGVLTGSRFNYSLFKDRKIWFFNASFIPDDTKDVVNVPKLYQVEFFNGGFKLELGYRWVFLFVPTNIDIEQLDGTTFGRGLAVTNLIPFVDVGWMPGNEIPGHMFYISPIVGTWGSVTFPKMKFKINPKVKKKK